MLLLNRASHDALIDGQSGQSSFFPQGRSSRAEHCQPSDFYQVGQGHRRHGRDKRVAGIWLYWVARSLWIKTGDGIVSVCHRTFATIAGRVANSRKRRMPLQLEEQWQKYRLYLQKRSNLVCGTSQNAAVAVRLSHRFIGRSQPLPGSSTSTHCGTRTIS